MGSYSFARPKLSPKIRHGEPRSRGAHQFPEHRETMAREGNHLVDRRVEPELVISLAAALEGAYPRQIDNITLVTTEERRRGQRARQVAKAPASPDYS